MAGQDITLRFRVDPELAEAFADAVERAPGRKTDASKVLRQFAAWYAGEQDAAMPRRPEPKNIA